jgi:Kef-type K+ transport system membrane component KefB
MDHLWIPTVAGFLVMLASLASVELGISVALIEISLGVVAGNVLGLQSPPWMDFLASFGSIVLTFLAGAEVDPEVMRARHVDRAHVRHHLVAVRPECGDP